MSAAAYATEGELAAISKYMTPANALALEISYKTGLRIGDVLKIRSSDVIKARDGEYIAYVASKTGKYGIAPIDHGLYRRIKEAAPTQRGFIFPGRINKNKPRSRQAVYRDMIRAAGKAGVTTPRISPHSARKCFAVAVFDRDGLEAVKERLQHSHDTTAILYAFSRELTRKGNG